MTFNEIISKLLKLNKTAAIALLTVMGLVAIAAVYAQNKIDAEDLYQIGILVLAAFVFFALVSQFTGFMAKIATWLVFGFSVCYMLLFSYQTMFRPPLENVLQAGCFFHPFKQGCPAYHKDEADRVVQDIITPENTPLDIDTAGAVYVQFAGSLDRDDVIDVAMSLLDVGWKMQGATRGGERIGSAYGKNEVRYFYPEDKQSAELLALEFDIKAKWASGIVAKDFSEAGFKNVAKGTLEVWTSRL